MSFDQHFTDKLKHPFADQAGSPFLRVWDSVTWGKFGTQADGTPQPTYPAFYTWFDESKIAPAVDINMEWTFREDHYRDLIKAGILPFDPAEAARIPPDDIQ